MLLRKSIKVTTNVTHYTKSSRHSGEFFEFPDLLYGFTTLPGTRLFSFELKHLPYSDLLSFDGRECYNFLTQKEKAIEKNIRMSKEKKMKDTFFALKNDLKT